jgi:DNA-binding GntR family transcriptional regulator
MDSAPTELDTLSVVDALTVALRGLVLGGSLAGGTRLTEQEVASRFNVARPTAKAAIERLVHGGLLRRTAHKSAHVPHLTISEVKDLYYSRTLLESSVVAALAGESSVPAGARQAVAMSRQSVLSGSLADFVNSDIAFHQALVGGLASPRLTRMHDSILGEAHLCMAQVQVHHLLNGAEIEAEHEGILAAIAAGDPSAASAALTNHLARARAQLVAYLEAASQS